MKKEIILNEIIWWTTYLSIVFIGDIVIAFMFPSLWPEWLQKLL